MPEPSQVHVDAALTAVSVAYRNPEYAADAVAPPVPVRKQSDKYFVYDAEREWMRPSPDRRSPGAEANEVNFSVSTDNYFCDDHALEAAIPDEERDNADPAIQPDIDRTEFLTEKIALNREIALAGALAQAGGVPGAALSGEDLWDNPDSNPFAVFAEARASVLLGTQRLPNLLLLSSPVFEVLRNHPAVVERIKHTSAGIVTEDLLAQLAGVARVVVGRAYKNTAARGQAPVMVPVWGRHAYFLHVAARPGLKQISGVYTFVWTGASGGTDGTVVERWREPRRKADMIRVQKYYDHKIVAPAAIYRVSDAVS
jgi:hypothetical protein